MQAQHIYSVVEKEFEAVNEIILGLLQSDVDLVETISSYLVDSGGKRIRPLLVLLATKCCGYQGKENINLAAIIEFLHTATLLHDDVVDMSQLRRGRSTANAMWGNAPSVLVGDFLYSRAFQMMVALQNMRILSILADSTNTIAEGEVRQLVNCHNPQLAEKEYMEVILAKTAVLFQASSHTGAVLAGATSEQEKALENYGLYLGMAFQLIDDVLDYQGNAEEMGKNIGDDLAEGKATLPLIYAMQKGSEQQAALIKGAIENGGLDNLEEIIDIVHTTGALNYTQDTAFKYRDKAIEELAKLPDNAYNAALKELVELAVNRSK